MAWRRAVGRMGGVGLWLGIMASAIAPAMAVSPRLDGLPLPPAVVASPRLAQGEDLEALPATKTLTLVVEGDPEPVDFLLYRQGDRPLVTYYPASMAMDDFCDASGCGISFFNEATATGMFFIFPAGATLASDIEPNLMQLLADNEWAIVDEYSDDPYLDLPWAKKMLSFRAADLSLVGMAYLGELNGQSFAAIALFPPDAGDGFVPLANAMLTEVRVR